MQSEFRITVSKSYEGRYYGSFISMPADPGSAKIIQEHPSNTVDEALDEIEKKYRSLGSPGGLFYYAGQNYASFDEARTAVRRDAAAGKI